jgi:hypothetical protein
MPNPIDFLPNPSGLVVAFGDSLTDSGACAKYDTQLYLPVLVGKLNEQGANVVDQNMGHDGGNSNSVIPGVLARMFSAWMVGTPVMGIIWIGTNDLPGHSDSNQTISALTSSGTTATATITSNAGLYVGSWVTVSGANQSNYNGTFQIASLVSTTGFTYVMTGTAVSPATGTLSCNTIALPQTTQNIMAAVKCLKFGCGINTGGVSIVGGQASLPANMPPGQRMVVMVDTSATGGCVPATGQSSRITGDYSASAQQTVWESSNNQAGILGWFRVAIGTTPPTHVKRILVFGNHYLNWASGGDTQSTQYPTWADDITGLRYYQAAAATAEAVATASASSLTSENVSVPIVSLTSSSTTATATTAVPHGLEAGDNTTIAGATQSEYNGGYAVVSAPTPTTFTYAFAGSATSPATTTTGINASVATATLTTTAEHGLWVGASVTVAGATPSAYNGTFFVTSIPSTTSLTFTLILPLESPATGSITVSWAPVVYMDIRPLMSARIAAGTDVQGSATWQFQATDIHLNPYGDELVAEFALTTILAQPGWLEALV